MNISIVGAGNIGTQIAVHAASQGHSVIIFTGKYNYINQNLRIIDENNKVFLQGKIQTATDNPDIAFVNADIIIITLPSFCQREFADKFEKYANVRLKLLFFPGTGGCECTFRRWINKGTTIWGVQRVPSVARLVKYGNCVKAIGYRKEMFVASIPYSCGHAACDFISDLFGIPCILLPNYLNVTLTPSNAILHTTRLYRLFKDFCSEKTYDKIPLFYEDWDIESSNLLLECDEEVQNICRILNKHFDLDYVRSLKEHYESNTAFDLKNKISSIKGFKGIETPCIKIAGNSYIPDFNSRYFRADFPYGLKILQEIGKIANVQTPYIDMIWFWFQQICFPTSYFKFSEYGINDINDFIDFYMD